MSYIEEINKMSNIDPKDIDGWERREHKKRDKRLKKRKKH